MLGNLGGVLGNTAVFFDVYPHLVYRIDQAIPEVIVPGFN